MAGKQRWELAVWQVNEVPGSGSGGVKRCMLCGQPIPEDDQRIRVEAVGEYAVNVHPGCFGDQATEVVGVRVAR